MTPTIDPIELRRIVDESLKRHRPALDVYLADEWRRVQQQREARKALIALLLVVAGAAWAVFARGAS